VKRISSDARRSLFNIKQIQLNVQRFYIDVKRIEIAVMRKISESMRKISAVKVPAYDNYQKFFGTQRQVFDAYKSSMYFQANLFALNLEYSNLHQ
jgi:hypothetical protein